MFKLCSDFDDKSVAEIRSASSGRHLKKIGKLISQKVPCIFHFDLSCNSCLNLLNNSQSLVISALHHPTALRKVIYQS